MNVGNEETPESHAGKCQLRLQKRRVQLRREENVGLKKQARKHKSNSKPSDSEMPAEVSIQQPQAAGQSECNACRHEKEITTT